MIRLFSLLLINFLTIFATANAANFGKDYCMQHKNAAHCSYTNFDIKPSNPNVGKYVRISKTKSHLSMILCLTQDKGNTLSNSEIEEGINTRIWSIGNDNLFQYEQCLNSNCSQTIGGVQNDKFTIIKIKEHEYVTEPKLFIIRLYNNEGLNCS